ncbi:MAG: GNAT family N-acetyltransferase, partial [Bryobacteraceae bacterium]
DGVTEMELGWWVTRHRWGYGLATEAALAALADLQSRCYLGRVISMIHAEKQAIICRRRKDRDASREADLIPGVPCSDLFDGQPVRIVLQEQSIQKRSGEASW